jgi:uncharacterized protein
MSSTTPSITTTLRECHRLRKHLRELKSEIDLGPRVQKVQEQTLANAKQAHAGSFETIQKLKLQIRDEEGNLKQFNTQLSKFEKQLNDAGTPKEYEGKQSEIRQAKEKIATTEELILTLMDDLETRTNDIPNVEKTWAAAQADFATQQAEGKERLDRLKTEHQLASAELLKQEANLPNNMKPQYDRLIKAYGPDGLAAVEGKVCQQCRTTIGEQQRNDLIAGKYLCCSSCHRALYLATNPIPANTADD